MKKVHEQQLHTNEMKMLRWAGGVTRLDKVRNDYVRGSFKVAPIVEKVKESRLRWYGHIQRREDDDVVKKVLNIPKSTRGRGKPPATWWNNIKKEMDRDNLSTQTTQKRVLWRKCTGRPDPR
ncbi:uncharacterized protein LOC125226544 [Leguminivora glycinivorella]|uniref:uncharacterized protein LOC125226544 n=1 Tax=Leguminivora glycinivorella TaxID=1035111 RepID=UPI00200F2D06|nr:uncharacterized protein LOC125226544 [Leguminivora glycinivorella]